MNKLLLSLSIVAVTLGFTACKKKDNTPANTSTVMFVNGCAGTGNVDGWVNGVKQNNVSNVAFLKNSGYQSVPSGSVALAFYLTAQGTPLSNTTQTLNIGARYSMFSSGLVTGTSFVFTTDDLNTPAAGKAKIRFINLSSDNLSTDCYVGTNKIGTDVTYKTCTPFYEVTAGTNLKIAMIDKTIASISGDLSNQTLTAGKIYTYMLTGTATGSGTSVITLSVINNN